VSPLTETLAAGRAVTRFNTLLASAFGALALLLAAVGIYGLTANEVASRWRDVAIRMALGANFRTATWSIVRPVVIAVAIGLAMGVAGAIAVSRSVAALLHGVHPLDIPTFVIVCLLLGLVAVGAAASAAVRVLRNQPAATLRA
jgi:putative ABC transport system permease protein